MDRALQAYACNEQAGLFALRVGEAHAIKKGTHCASLVSLLLLMTGNPAV